MSKNKTAMSIGMKRIKYHKLFKFFCFAITITILGFIYFCVSITLYSINSRIENGVSISTNPLYSIMLYIGIGIFAFICFLSIFARIKLDKAKKLLTSSKFSLKDF